MLMLLKSKDICHWDSDKYGRRAQTAEVYESDTEKQETERTQEERKGNEDDSNSLVITDVVARPYPAGSAEKSLLYRIQSGLHPYTKQRQGESTGKEKRAKSWSRLSSVALSDIQVFIPRTRERYLMWQKTLCSYD